MNRSIQRDFDISYYTQCIMQNLQDLKEDFQTLRNIGYEPSNLIEELNKTCAIITQLSES